MEKAIDKESIKGNVLDKVGNIDEAIKIEELEKSNQLKNIIEQNHSS